MLTNYLKFAFRQIKKNKLYSFLNILGLSLGLACFFVIYLFIKNELSYDQHHANKDNIYRAIKTVEFDTGVDKLGGLTAAMAPTVAGKIPEIEAYTRISRFPKRASLISSLDSVFSLQSTSVDLGFNDIFDLNYILGSRETSFQTENSALITRTKAIQMYGSIEGAINQELKIAKSVFRIDGVIEDSPVTSSIAYTFLLPFNAAEKWRGEGVNSWSSSYSDQSFFLLHPEADANKVEQEIDKIFHENVNYGDYAVSLQSLNDIHFSLDVLDGLRAKSDRQYIAIFSFVAVFILLCAVFNYVSLSLSQSVHRVKEMGVRKVLGANRKQLLQQYMFESMIYVTIATIISIVIVELTIPVLEEFLGRSMQFSFIDNPELILQGLAFALLLAVLSSLYPAYICLKLQAASMLKGTGDSIFSSQRLINAITVFQIVVFLTLICSAFVASRQMDFMQNENLGFDNERMLIIRMTQKGLRDKSEVLKNELKQLSNIERISYASSIPTSWGSTLRFDPYKFTFFNFKVDENYLETMGMELILGRNFLPSDADTASITLINETAAIKMEVEDDPIGKTIMGKRIIGVVSDFHLISKKEPIAAVMFDRVKINSYGMLILKLKSDNLKGTITEVQEVYESVTDNTNMDYFFLDEQFNTQYKQETVITTMINAFTLIAALVAFIGLFGISGYSVSRRLKEMGIRKVLGADFFEIQKKLNYSNLIKIIVAILIAIPLTVYWMDNWLNSFAYRIEIPIWVLGMAAMTATIVILLTVSIHSVKAYFINPIEILKEE